MHLNRIGMRNPLYVPQKDSAVALQAHFDGG